MMKITLIHPYDLYDLISSAKVKNVKEVGICCIPHSWKDGTFENCETAILEILGEFYVSTPIVPFKTHTFDDILEAQKLRPNVPVEELYRELRMSKNA